MKRAWSPLQGASGERGQVLLISAFFLLVVLGAMALTIDFGRVALEKRRIQNGADAAALAGALSLPVSTAKAQSDAIDWAAKNTVTSAEITNNSVSSVKTTNDTITVGVTRTVAYTVAQVLAPFGMPTSATVTATASARIAVLNGVTAGQRAYPWAVWDGNPVKKKLGDSVTFRSNDYAGANVNASVDCTKNKKAGCTWDINGTNFKGYFHWQNGYQYYVEPTSQAFDQGGNSFGTSDQAALYAAYQSGTPVILPMINWSSDAGTNLHFVIPAFVCIKITQMDTGGSIDWKGTIVKCTGPGLTDGDTPPSLTSAFTTKLVN